MSSSIILNIPHSSTLLPRVDIPRPFHEPKELIHNARKGREYTIDRILEGYRKELPYMTDWYTDELFINGIGKPLVATVSRLLCDTERYRDDNKEEMSVIGMGICYTSNHNLDKLASFKLEHKLQMIEKYYDPYHRTLSQYTDEALKRNKYALVLDCHSFSDIPYMCDINNTYGRPDICIGTDSDHTPNELSDILVQYFSSLGYDVRMNYPFSGTMIPNGFEKNPRLLAVMIEINRKLYLDWNGGNVKKKEEFYILKKRIHEVEKLIEDYVDSRA